jgi:hypothetical protein
MDYRERVGSGMLEFARRHYLALLVAGNLALIALVAIAYQAPDCEVGATLIRHFIAMKGHGDTRDVFITCTGAGMVYSLEKNAFIPPGEAAEACRARGCGLWTQDTTRRKRDVCYCMLPPEGITSPISVRRCYKVVFKDILGMWKIGEEAPCGEGRDFCCKM